MKQLSVVVDRLSRQGKNNLAVTLVPVDQQKLPTWQAGDHIDVFLPNQLVRQYSLTGRPNEQNEYLICIKKEQKSRGGSRYVHEQLRIGQTLNISLPRNAFPLVTAQRYILLAAGIGITPLLAFAEQLEAQQTPFELFYYVKDLEDVAFTKRWQKGFQHGRCHLLLSNHGQSVRHGLPEICHQANPLTQLYLCGPEAFMQHCQLQAMQLGWSADQIQLEAFAPSKNKSSEETHATSAEFKVILRSTGQSFDVPADKTIAQTLMEQNIVVSVSCEMGMCGACLTRVYQGEIDHHDTVQTESEKNAAEQYIALCCSRAKSAILEIAL
jgi:vanillate O-demethylase ferredoxin subunit